MGLTEALLLDPYPFEIFIAHREDGIRGSGTLNDPYRANTADEFDAVMRTLAGPTLVHLGVGYFYTNGYTDAAPSSGWQMIAGTRIVGAGLASTRLILVNATSAGHYYAIGHALVDSDSGASVRFCGGGIHDH